MKKAFFVAVTIVISIILLEIGVRVLSFISPEFRRWTFSDPSDQLICKQEERLEKLLKKYSQSTGFQDSMKHDKFDSLLGWVTKPNFQTGEYSTNSVGFRGTKEFSLLKQKKRIIFVGDSFTWGQVNRDNETFPYYLDRLFNESVDVINMGVHGYGPGQFFLYFMREGLKYNPDVVVFGLLLPDIHRSIYTFTEYFKPRFIINNGDLQLDITSSPIPDFKTALRLSVETRQKNRLYSFSLLNGLFKKALRRYTSYKEDVSITLKIIEEMHSKLKENNIKLIILLIPAQEMVEGNNEDYHNTVPQLIDYFEEHKIYYINLQPAIKREYDTNGQSLYYGGHLKSMGNLLIANELFPFLNEHNILIK